MAALEKKAVNTSVILVDNSSIDNFVNTKIIMRYQFADNVLSFNKSEKALKYLLELNASSKEEIPFILFLDLDMPEIDGIGFLNAFNLLPDKIKGNIQIVILTNSFDPKDAEICSKHNSVFAFFHKPLIKSNLEDIEQLLLKKSELFKKAC